MLHDADLSGADFFAANLEDVEFLNANLSLIGSGCSGSSCTVFDNANLCGANLDSALLGGSFAGTTAGLPSAVPGCDGETSMRDATFFDADLSEAVFDYADLSGATFDPASLLTLCTSTTCLSITNAKLEGAVFADVDLSVMADAGFADLFESIAKDSLSRIMLSFADFSGANLTGLVMNNADKGADLSGADFEGANLTGLSAQNGDFDFANFTGANLDGVDFSDATFENAEFAFGASSAGSTCVLPRSGTTVDLRNAKLAGANLRRARHFQKGCILVDSSTTYNDATKFPDDINLDLIESMTRL
jgi:uncharacterized protein YjbI with pentapeptide repeats